jgi:glycosyltransferase involved in cell wall biosynthesis
MPPAISLIIPARNEEALLPRLLDTVDVACARFAQGADAIEVIVVDNVSTDATAAIAAARGARVVREETRVIGEVRNAGARVAQGEILCFVDADARIHPETFNAVVRRLADPRVVGGASGVHLERWSLGILLTYVLIVSLVWLMRMDTGVVFCWRRDFEAMGGYRPRVKVGEDVLMLWDLRRLGRARRQHLVRATEVKALSSMRKFDRHGDWYYFGMLWAVIAAALRGRPVPEDLAQRIWYGR